jgi:hypothetical protein
MKISTAQCLLLVLLVFPMAGASAQNISQMTVFDWLSLTRDARLGFVAGYIDSLQLLSRRLGTDLVPRPDGNMTPEAWNQRLYDHIMKQPDLRPRLVGDVLFALVESASVRQSPEKTRSPQTSN